MLNVVGKLVKSGKEAFDALDSKINFSIPENLVMYLGINGRKDDRDLQLNKDNFRLQIGKMEKEKETIYTEEILLPAIEYILKKAEKDQKAIIQLRPDLAKFLANEDQKKESNQILSFEEEKQKIVKLIKKHFKEQKQHIEIVNISQQYPEIFNILKEHGKDGLSSLEKPILDKESFSALSLAKYLYRLSQNNKKFRELLYNTKTPLQKNNDKNPIGENQSDYYSLIEVSIRLYEILSGVYIQGGIDRQSKYDKIIGGILQRKDIDTFKVKDYPELEELHQFCNQIQENILFDRLYINTKGVRQVTEKKQVLSKAKNALLLVLGLGIGGIATNQVNTYVQKIKEKTATEETMKEIFETKKLPWTGDFGYGEYLGEQKIEQINTYKEDIYKRFLLRYGDGDQMRKGEFKNTKFTKENIESKIISCLNNQEILNILGTEYSSSEIAIEDQIIDDYLIPNNIGEFKNNISTTPYEKLLPYTDQFINTILCDSKIEIESDSTYSDLILPNVGFYDKSYVEVIGDFTPKYVGSNQFSFYNYKLALTKLPNTNKQYILAGGTYVGDNEEKRPYTLSISRGQELAIDFLRQTQPVINELLELYLYRYYIHDDTHFIGPNGPHKNVLPRSITYILVKDFLKKGMLYKISKEDKIKLFNYIDHFVIEQQAALAPHTGDINSKLLPNGFLSNYEDAMKNTITDQNVIFDTYGRLPITSFGENNTVAHLGQYQASDGKIYKVGIVELMGKRYLYANDILSGGYGELTYGPWEGETVAKDYLSTKAKFMEQKILRDKQQKSASQKHVDKPRDLLKNDGSGSRYKVSFIPPKK